MLQSLSTYLAEINHHEGLYNKLLDVQAAYTRSAAAAARSQVQQHDSTDAITQVRVVQVAQRYAPVGNSQQPLPLCSTAITTLAADVPCHAAHSLHV
jgi:hypothetical protein